MEEAFKDVSKAFNLSTKLAFGWVSDTNRKTVEQGAKIEDNQKGIQSNQEQIQNNVSEISGANACIELHEDRIARLEEKVKEQENTLLFQGQLVERLEGQLQHSEGTVQELMSRIDILTQPVTLTHLPVQYVSSIPPEQFLG